jgi:amino acid transporter
MRLFRRDADGDGVPDERERGGVATREAPEERGDRVADDGPRDDGPRGNGIRDDRTAPRPAGRRAGGVPAWRRDGSTARDAELRRRDEFGGMNLGASFFGWLVAIGMAVIVTSILAAAGAAIGLTNGAPDAKDANTVSIVGGALLVATLMLAYFCGGYVAGRMSRFDGGRQGFGTWLIGLLVTLLIAGAGAVFGSKYNVFSGLHLPRIPVDEGSLATGGAIALAAVVLGTLIAAIFGGKAGQRYHTRVDRAGYAD